ncbi:MAG: ABC transporter substrate-binding protein [Eubacteriales bacterium]|nr:ABC transporter substrate-binding protein [Eubacteriales bacterium]
MKRESTKKSSAFIVAVFIFVLAGIMSGCGEKKEAEATSNSSDKAMGRYVEEKLDFPDDVGQILDVEVMEDGAIWAATPYYVLSSEDSGKTWEEVYSLDEVFPELQTRTEEQFNSVLNIKLGKKKDIAITLTKYFDYQDTNKEYWFGSVWYRDSEGNVREILEDQDNRNKNMVSNISFDSEGNILAQVTMKGILHFSTETGELLHTFQEGEDNYGFGVCGNILISFFNANEVRYFDLETGKPLEDDAVLTKQMVPNLMWGNASPLVFAEDSGQAGMLICDREGIYSHTFGGNVMEQLVDSTLCTLGDTSSGYMGFTRDKDNSFYVVKTVDGGDRRILFELYRYYYDANMPTVPDEELKVYALDDYPELKQAALLYQKEHPEVRVKVESLMDEIGENSSSSDGYLDMRRVDALKTLNTEILAGKGPDVLVLDQMPVKAYMEKGILEDISGILKESGILPNIAEAYTQQDGKIYSMPARIRIPIIFGDKLLLEKGTDLGQLSDMIAEVGEGLGSNETVYPYFSDGELSEILIYAYSFQWMNEDGTLKEENVRDFIEQLGIIKNSDVEEKNSERGTYGGNSPYEKGIGLSLIPVYTKQSKLTFGELCSPSLLEQIESMVRDMPELKWETIEPDTFRPWMTIGISTKANNKERAEEFLTYMFGADAQGIQQGNGFSVNESVVDSEDYWGINKQEDASLPKNSISYEMFEGGKRLEFYSITDEQFAHIREILRAVSAPYNLDVQVKLLIKDEAQSYLREKETLDEAMSSLMDKINLYLSE